MPPPYGDCAGLPGLERVLRGVGTDRRRAHRRAPGQWWAGTGRRPALKIADVVVAADLVLPETPGSHLRAGQGVLLRLRSSGSRPSDGCRTVRRGPTRSGAWPLPSSSPIPTRPPGRTSATSRPGRRGAPTGACTLRRPAPPRRHLGQVPRPRPPARHRAAGRAGRGRPVAVVPVEVLRLRDARDRADRALAGGQRAPAQGQRGLPHHLTTANGNG